MNTSTESQTSEPQFADITIVDENLVVADHVEPTPSSRPSVWPMIGGGLLALGIMFSTLPSAFENAINITSPIFGILEAIGVVSLISAVIVLGAVAIVSIAHTSRHSAVR